MGCGAPPDGVADDRSGSAQGPAASVVRDLHRCRARGPVAGRVARAEGQRVDAPRTVTLALGAQEDTTGAVDQDVAAGVAVAGAVVGLVRGDAHEPDHRRRITVVADLERGRDL